MRGCQIVVLLGVRCEFVRATFGAERFDRHVHDEFSLGLVLTGANVFSYRSGIVEALAGSVCVADPGEMHDSGLAGALWSYMNLFVPASAMAALLDERDVAREPATGCGTFADPAISAAMGRLFALLAEGGEQEGAEEAAALALTLLMERGGTHALAPEAPDDRVAQRALAMIRDADGIELTLDGIAREVGASRTRIVRSVSRAIGVTPMCYATHLRVTHAKRLIATGTPIGRGGRCGGLRRPGPSDAPHEAPLRRDRGAGDAGAAHGLSAPRATRFETSLSSG